MTPGGQQRSSLEAPASAPSKNALKPWIKEILPKSQPGLFPDDISEELMKRNPHRMLGQNLESVKAKVRVALKELHDVGEVKRESATGAKGGSSYKYTCPLSEQAVGAPGPAIRSQQSAACSAGARTPGTPLRDNTQLEAASPRMSLEEGGRSNQREGTTGQQEMSNEAERTTHVARDDTVRLQRPGIPTDNHSVDTASYGRSAENGQRKQDTDSQDLLLQLGQKVQRMHLLIADLNDSMKEGAERKAQQQISQERCIALEREAQEEMARGADLNAEAQQLQDQLLMVKRRAAEPVSYTHLTLPTKRIV